MTSLVDNAISTHPRRILVVDDEPQITAVLSRYARAVGFQSRIAGNVDDAIRLVEAEEFDLILLDIILPGRTGFSAIQTLKRKSDAVIFIMTGYAADEIRKDAELLGADGVIQKPVEFEALVKIINGLKVSCGAVENFNETKNIDRR